MMVQFMAQVFGVSIVVSTFVINKVVLQVMVNNKRCIEGNLLIKGANLLLTLLQHTRSCCCGVYEVLTVQTVPVWQNDQSLEAREEKVRMRIEFYIKINIFGIYGRSASRFWICSCAINHTALRPDAHISY